MNRFACFLLICAFFSAGFPAFSQKMTAKKYHAANAYAEYLNQSSRSVLRLTKKLAAYYQKAENFRKGRSYSAPYRTEFRFEIPEYLLQKIEKNKPNLSPAERQSFETAFNQILETDKQILTLLQDLQVYLKLKDYEFDHFARSDSLLFALRAKFALRATLNRRVAQSLSALWQKAYAQSQNPHARAANAMYDVLTYERKLHEKWQYNLSAQTPTQSLPLREIAKTYQAHHARSFPHLPGLKHPASFYYKRFTGDHYHAQKAYILDKYRRQNQTNDKESNSAYENIIRYYNSSLITEFNSFSDAAKSKGIFINHAVRSSPQFKIDTIAKTLQPAGIRAQTNAAFETPAFAKKQKTPPKQQVEALNAYIDYINEEIRKSNSYTEHLLRYNQRLNKYTDGKTKYAPGSFPAFDRYKIPRSFYYKARGKGSFLDEKTRQYCNQTIELLNQICRERRQLISELHQYTLKRENIRKDKGKKAYKIFERLETLYTAFDQIKRRFHKALQECYATWQTDQNNSWYKSAEAMHKTLEHDRKLMYAVDLRFADSLQTMPPVTAVRNAARNCISNLYDNLKGIDKFGRSHGHCPHSPYEDVAQESIDFAIEVSKIEENITKTRDKADEQHDYVRAFNDIVEEYNRFVWLAKGEHDEASSHSAKPCFLIKTMRHPFNFWLTTPQNTPEQTPSDSVFSSMQGFAHNNLILLLDISSSMNQKAKFPLLKKSFSQLLNVMRPEDFVAIVSYSGEARLVLEPTSCSRRSLIRETLANLTPGGGSNIDDGIKKAYQTAQNNFIPQGNNRIILATDGQFAVKRRTMRNIEKGAAQNIFLSVFYFSENQSPAQKLEEIARQGKGFFTPISLQNINRALEKEVQAIKKDQNQN